MGNCYVDYCKDAVEHDSDFCKAHKKAYLAAQSAEGESFDYRIWAQAQTDLLLDVCPTPLALAAEICRRVKAVEVPDLHYAAGEPLRVVEPSAGEGVFVRAARALWPSSQITAIEIRKEMEQTLLDAGADFVYAEDVLRPGGVNQFNADLIIGNPPFAQAEEHITSLLARMKTGSHLAFLLRLGFYGAKARLAFWKANPEKYFMPITPRPGFKLNGKGKLGTDSQEYGVFIWEKGYTGPAMRLPHLVWDNGKRKGGGRKKVEAPELDAAEPFDTGTGTYIAPDLE